MNIKKFALKVLLTGAIAFGLFHVEQVQAQGDFDWFALDKVIQVINLCSNGAATQGTNTSNPIDVGHGQFIGSAYIDVHFMTNYGTNTGSVLFQTSPDQTNWTTSTNYALSLIRSDVLTNIYYIGTNGSSAALLATNYGVIPFTNTSPNAASAGYATAAPIPVPFTNTGAFTPYYQSPVSNAVGYITRVGIQNVSDLAEYVRLSVIFTGTNYFSAEFHGRRSK